MAKISLKKGNSEKISLKKIAPLLKNVRMEFQWTSDVNLDLDVSALLCRKNSKDVPEVLSPQHIVFYAPTNSNDPSRAVFYGGDVRDGTGDLESIDVDLEKVGKDVEEIAFVMTIDDASGNKTFGHATSGTFKLINADSNAEVLDFNFLEEEHKSKTIIHVVSLKRNAEDSWDVVGYGTGGKGNILDAFLMFGSQRDWFE